MVIESCNAAIADFAVLRSKRSFDLTRRTEHDVVQLVLVNQARNGILRLFLGSIKRNIAWVAENASIQLVHGGAPKSDECGADEKRGVCSPKDVSL